VCVEITLLRVYPVLLHVPQIGQYQWHSNLRRRRYGVQGRYHSTQAGGIGHIDIAVGIGQIDNAIVATGQIDRSTGILLFIEDRGRVI
jgi:hypothetical protein